MKAKNQAIMNAARAFLTAHLEGQFELKPNASNTCIEQWGEASFIIKGRNIDLVAKILRRTLGKRGECYDGSARGRQYAFDLSRTKRVSLGLDMYRGIIEVTVIDFVYGPRAGLPV